MRSMTSTTSNRNGSVAAGLCIAIAVGQFDRRMFQLAVVIEGRGDSELA